MNDQDMIFNVESIENSTKKVWRALGKPNGTPNLHLESLKNRIRRASNIG